MIVDKPTLETDIQDQLQASVQLHAQDTQYIPSGYNYSAADAINRAQDIYSCTLSDASLFIEVPTEIKEIPNEIEAVLWKSVKHSAKRLKGPIKR